MKTLVNILRWFFGITIILVGVTSISMSEMGTGFICLAIGLFLIPQVSNRIFNKKETVNQDKYAFANLNSGDTAIVGTESKINNSIKDEQQYNPEPTYFDGYELDTLEKLQFKKYISQESGMAINDIESYLCTLSDAEILELIKHFKSNKKT